ncbi:MAG: hypothetical protein FWC53_00085 [Firmicutes bacterium]|nr:hypothetical protein [Bacillota bacterium]
MDEINSVAKKIWSKMPRGIKIKFIAAGAGLLIVGVLVLNTWFGFTAKAIEVSNGSADIIKKGITFKDGVLNIDQSVYDNIKNALKEKGIDLDKTYPGFDIKKMVQAEVVTNYPHTGRGELQGDVYMKRDDKDLTYVTKADFDKKVQEAQSSGDFDKVKYYFTINDDNMDVIVASYTKKTVDGIVTEFTVTPQNLSYWSHITQFSMPYEFLYVLLVSTNSPDYVSAVADLAIKNTEINFTVLDSTSTYTTVTVYNHAVITRVDTAEQVDGGSQVWTIRDSRRAYTSRTDNNN